MRITLPANVGLVADQAAHEVADGAWTEVQNFRFAEGYAERCKGHTSIYTAQPARAYHVASYRATTGNFLISSTLTGAYADDGTTQTDITGTALTGAASDRFTSCVLGGVYCQSNAADEPMYWGGDTGTNLATLPGWDTNWRCGSLRAFSYYLLALDVTKSGTRYGSMVKWSDKAPAGAVPTSWDEADATKDAGEFDLAATSDNIVDGLAMGSMFVVYKEASMYGLQFIGGNDIFSQVRLPGDHGILAPNCAVQIPAGHVVLTPSDVVLHNGAGPASIMDGRVRRWLFGRIDSTNYRQSFLAHNQARQEVWICYPQPGSSVCDEALIWNYTGNTFGVRQLPGVSAAAAAPIDSSATDTWDSDSEPWDDDDTAWNQADISAADARLVMAGESLWLMDQSGKFNGTAFTQKLERTGLHLGTPEQTKHVRAVFLAIDAPTSTPITVQVGAAMDAETSPVWSTARTHTVGSTYRVDVSATGRFLALRLSSTTGSRWRLRSVTFDVVPMGMY